jgi:hypothetical protein
MTRWDADTGKEGVSSELAVCVISLWLAMGLLGWTGYLLSKAGVIGNAHNFGPLAVLGVFLLVCVWALGRQLVLQSSEIRSLTVDGPNALITFRLRPPRAVPLPFAGAQRRRVRLLSFTASSGMRSAIAVGKGVWDYIVIPESMPGLNELLIKLEHRAL